jgi:multicomponent Na+:H+ antiporter subunit D
VHGWLPTAAVAPTPVTALLHAVAVVKSGVFAIIRVTYFSFGTSVLEGSYAQYISLALSAFTIVFGSAMALKERHLKRRLAYSTVANLSYILFGALLMIAQGLYAGLMHLVFHALMKITLFLVVGVFNRRAHAYYIEDVRGIAKALPVLAVVFVIGSLAMTGIPPLIGFVSKWSLAEAAILSGGLLPLLGVSALLISAVLTGIYLIVPAVTMYTRPPVILAPQKVESGFYVTLLALSAMIIALSFYSGPLLDFLYQTALGAI